MTEVRAPAVDWTTRVIRWPIPAELDPAEVETGVQQVCGKIAEDVLWLREFHLVHGEDGSLFLEATITGKHQWMVHRRARSLARKLIRRFEVMFSEPDVCRLPEHPNRRAASSAASVARWQGSGEESPHMTR